MASKQPRKQRKAMYNTPLHMRRKQIASHLSEELLLKYNRRSMPVVTGDEVKVLRGDNKGVDGQIVEVDTKKRRVFVEGVNHKKADGTDVPLPMDPSNLVITRLNLEDERRRTKLGETDVPAPKKARAAKPAKTSKAGEAVTATAATADAAPAAEVVADSEDESTDGGEEE